MRIGQLLFRLRACLLLLLLFPGASAAGDWDQPPRPVSREVVPIGPGDKPECRTQYEVWGIGSHKDKRKATEVAILDAKRAACWYVALGPDGLVKTEAERKAFDQLAESFYAPETVAQFVPYVSDVQEKRKLEKKGRKVKVHLVLNADFCMIKTWLRDHQVLGQEWNPASIAVLPDVPAKTHPLRYLETHADARMAQTVIMNFLTKDDDFEPTETGAEVQANDIVNALSLLQDRSDDYAHGLAVVLGADIYFRFEVLFNENTQHGQRLRKAVVRLDAYETTTGRKLGSQSAYSESRGLQVPAEALVEEAVSSGARDILQRIKSYWAREGQRGVQYKVIIMLPEDADEDELLDIYDCFDACTEEIAKTSKLEVETQQRLDYRLWVDAKKIPRVPKLRKELRGCIRKGCGDWKLMPAGMVRGKLAVFRIERADRK